MSEQELFTSYQITPFVNDILKKVGLPPIRSQMLYNYTTGLIREGHKPRIPVVIVHGKAFVTKEGVCEWLDSGYLLKKGVRKSTSEIISEMTLEDIQ